MSKLKAVFRLAALCNVQARIDTNLNRLNAVYVYLDGYVLRLAIKKHIMYENWGLELPFLKALARKFPGEVYVDPPEGVNDTKRYQIDDLGNIKFVTNVIQTWDAV